MKTSLASLLKAPQPREGLVGHVLGERYELIDLLGRGGMGLVFRARDLTLGEEVAIKLILPDLRENADTVTRFEAEGRRARRLSHPNVLRVFNLETVEDQEVGVVMLIVMELLRGCDLVTHLRVRQTLCPEETVALALQALAGLGHAHDNRLVHRDIKPANLFVTVEGIVKILDFGIAKSLVPDMGPETRTGNFLGSPAYMAPEQIRPALDTSIETSADLYAMSILLYRCVAGVVPFEGDSPMTVAVKQLEERPAPPSRHNPSVPAELEAVILKGLEKNPARRYETAAEMADALRRAVPAGADFQLRPAIVLQAKGDGAPAPENEASSMATAELTEPGALPLPGDAPGPGSPAPLAPSPQAAGWTPGPDPDRASPPPVRAGGFPPSPTPGRPPTPGSSGYGTPPHDLSPQTPARPRPVSPHGEARPARLKGPQVPLAVGSRRSERPERKVSLVPVLLGLVVVLAAGGLGGKLYLEHRADAATLESWDSFLKAGRPEPVIRAYRIEAADRETLPEGYRERAIWAYAARWDRWLELGEPDQVLQDAAGLEGDLLSERSLVERRTRAETLKEEQRTSADGRMELARKAFWKGDYPATLTEAAAVLGRLGPAPSVGADPHAALRAEALDLRRRASDAEVEPLLEQGRRLVARRDWKRALSVLREATEKAPSHLGARAEFEQVLARVNAESRALFERGERLRRTGQTAAASGVWKDLIRRYGDPDNEYAKRALQELKTLSRGSSVPRRRP